MSVFLKLDAYPGCFFFKHNLLHKDIGNGGEERFQQFCFSVTILIACLLPVVLVSYLSVVLCRQVGPRGGGR